MRIRFKVYLLLTTLYALLIFFISSSSNPGNPGMIFDFLDREFIHSIVATIKGSDLSFFLYPLYLIVKHPDKLFHIVLYAGFGSLLYLTLKNSSNYVINNNAILLAIIIGILYGASDEFHQSFVPGRSATTWDFVADVIGVIIAQVMIFVSSKLLFKQKSTSLQYKKHQEI